MQFRLLVVTSAAEHRKALFDHNLWSGFFFSFKLRAIEF